MYCCNDSVVVSTSEVYLNYNDDSIVKNYNVYIVLYYDPYISIVLYILKDILSITLIPSVVNFE